MIADLQQRDDTLQIDLLGTLVIKREGRTRPLPTSRKTRGLLAYLALATAPCRRADLCDLLWEDVADPRGELRWSLCKIRDAIGPWLLTSGESVSILRERLVVDAVKLRRLAEVPMTARAVRDALSLWRGEPLVDADISGCHRYHLWWLAECEALTAVRSQLLHVSVERAWPSPSEALIAARGLVAHRPFDERGHARVVQALQRARRGPEAIAYLADVRSALSAELGLSANDVLTFVPSQPSPSSAALAAEAVRQRPAARPPVYLAPLDVWPPESAMAVLGASITAKLTVGLWRGKVCELLESIGYGSEAVEAVPASARFILRGSLVRLIDGARLTLRCVEAQQGVVVWCGQSGPYLLSGDTPVGELERIVAAIEAAIRHAEIDFGTNGEFAIHARSSEMLALASALEPTANRHALQAADAILAENPDEPIALAAAAWCHAQRAVYNWSIDAEIDRRESQRLASIATLAGSDDPNCLTIIAAARTLVADHVAAGALLDQALRQNPGAGWAYARKGWLANYNEMPDLAIRCFRMALQLTPANRTEFNNLVGLGVAHFIKGEYELAIRRMEQGLALNPKATWIQRNLVPAYAAAGRHADAVVGLRALLQEHQHLSIVAVESAMVFSKPVMAKIAQGLAEVGLRRV